MVSQGATVQPSRPPGPRRSLIGRPRAAERPVLAIRSARSSEAPVLHTLINASVEEGHVLPRELDELELHADRFLVVTEHDRIVACAELAPLSDTLAEVRSLVVDENRRGIGLGRQIVEELRRRARRDGFAELCAFTHAPEYFVRMGFSIVPHERVPEKIATDCCRCPLFRVCGQYAVIVDLDPPADRPLRRGSVRSRRLRIVQ